MRKALLAGLLISTLATALPASAQGQFDRVRWQVPSAFATTTVVLPEGDLLTEAELSEVEGKLAPLGIFAVRIIGGAVLGAVAGGVGSFIADGDVSWQAVAAGAAGGAAAGAWGAFLKVRGW